MHRAIPVGNKVCAARVKKRYEEQRAQRLRDMKGMVDHTAPHVMGLRHLKTNWKRDEMTAQRYDTIDRDNRTLLNKMHDIAGHRDYSVARSASSPILNDPPGGPHRQRETDRINQENALILKRLQGARAEYRTKEWEDDYKNSHKYLKIKCEYPLVAMSRRSASTTGASLTRLPNSKMVSQDRDLLQDEMPHEASHGRLSTHVAAEEDDVKEKVGEELKFAFRDEIMLGDACYLVDMATDGQVLCISACETQSGQTLEMIVNEENHLRLLEEAEGDYSLIAQQLRLEGGQLVL